MMTRAIESFFDMKRTMLSLSLIILAASLVVGVPTDHYGRYADIAAMRATTDGGRTWHTMPAPHAEVGMWDPGTGSRRVQELRFANTKDGWAFNPSLFATHDGGKTWADNS